MSASGGMMENPDHTLQKPTSGGGRRGDDGLSVDDLEFIRAIDVYKRKHNRPFPTWSEVLRVVKELGYRK